VFAIRQRIGYFIREDVLYATDLTSKELPMTRLAGAPKQTWCAQSDKGIIVWSGTTWETIPWLGEWPQK